MTTRLQERIRRSVANVVRSDGFRSWQEAQEINPGDLVVLNNSFLFRKSLITTVKNHQFLCARVSDTRVEWRTLAIAKSPPDFDVDFKCLSAKSKNQPDVESLSTAIRREHQAAGRLVYVLLGALSERSSRVQVKHGSIGLLSFDPSKPDANEIETAEDGSLSLVVGKLNDPESAWQALAPALASLSGGVPPGLEAAFAQAFERLRDEARLVLSLPSRHGAAVDGTFIGRLRESVGEQQQHYEDALRRHRAGGDGADGHLRDAMRIAYNFADDALKVLQLVVGVADLKAVVLWATIHEHLCLAEAFRDLPWTKSHKKPSLERYREIIGGARNRAFHNLLSFDRTIDADLAGVQVGARSLTLLRAHGRQGVPSFDYEDREMIELLGQLTRAPEAEVPLGFWHKNARVMGAFEALLAATDAALRDLLAS